MLQGTATLDAAAYPRVDAPATDALALPGADVLLVAWELWAGSAVDLFPPALHPVNPPVVQWTFLRARESVHGSFTLAEMRLVCRSGMRTRGYHLDAWCDSPAVADVLRAGWGYRVTVADVSLSRRFDGTSGRVDGVLDTGHTRPLRLTPDDVQYTATMHPAVLARGLRLLQVERDHDVHQAERGTPYLRSFVHDRLRPSFPVSASSARADVVLRPVRYACRPEVSAFEGTEPI
jgi:hypothetical protein